MTLKTISFGESEVMRELERKAIGNKKIEPTVSDIVKTASLSKSAAPTNDLYSDLIRLSNLIKEKGFVKEAESLENKIFIFKQAETHLYRAIDEDGEDLINFSHRDGDHKVSDAKDQNGMVETILSQHKKIVDVVNKKPTGKNASLINNIISATAEILNVNLKKNAQESEETPEEQLATMQLSEEQRTERDQLNTAIDAKATSVLEGLNSASQLIGETGTIPDWLQFKFGNLLKGWGVELFAQSVKIPVQNIQAALEAYKKYYGMSESPKGETNKYNIGRANIPTDTIKTTLKQDFGVEPESLKGDEKIIDQIVWANVMDKQIIPLITARIPAANAAVNAQLEPIRKKIASLQKMGASLKNYKIRKNVAIIAGIWMNFIKNVNEVTRLVASSPIFTNVGAEAIKAQTVLTLTQNVYLPSEKFVNESFAHSSLPGAKSVALSAPERKEKLVAIKNIASEIAQNFNLFLSQKVGTAQEQADVSDNFKEASAIFAALNKKEDLPFEYLSASMPKQFQTPEELEAYLKTGRNISIKLLDKYKIQKKSFINNNLTKFSWQDEGKEVVKEVPSTPKPGATPSAKHPISGKVRTSGGARGPSWNKSVALMQWALNNLGRGLGGPKGFEIIGTGPKSNPTLDTFDGIWGPNTEHSLNLANEIVGGKLDTRKRWNSAEKKHEDDTDTVAVRNAQIINQYNAQQKFETVKDIKSAGTLDQLQEGTDFSEASLTQTGGKVSLAPSDVQSLSSLYSFLVSKLKVIPRKFTVEDPMQPNVVGFTLGDWDNLLKWFMRRAKYLNSEGYHQRMVALWQRLSKAPKFGVLDANYPISASILSKIDGETGMAQMAPGERAKSVEEGVRERGGTGEEGDIRRKMKDKKPEELTIPFDEDDNINLQSKVWQDLDWENKGVITPILKLEDFRRVNGVQMANAITQSAGGGWNSWIAAAKAAGISNFRPEDAEDPRNLNKLTVMLRDGSWVPIKSVPEIRRFVNQMGTVGSLDTYQSFLGELKAKLGTAFKEWAKTAPPAQISAMTEPYQRWQQAIAKQLRDIVRSREEG